MPKIGQKYQLIDDQSVFQVEELEGLTKKDVLSLKKLYHTISIIGAQSSGKSTLLNAIFGTTFDELNRRKGFKQTTKGIWYSIDSDDSMMVIDVEGSDSNERQERTKIQRRNSSFALAVSHTLLINLWIQQIGLHEGSQLQILQIILELNLRLFGSEQPKNIIFVVRDYDKTRQNREVLKQKLVGKVEDAWQKIKKPPGKQHIKLNDLFELNSFFLASKLDEPEEFQEGVLQLKKYLVHISKNEEIIKSNISMEDLPQYMKNIWETIETDKDINLPKEKILLSQMKCQEIKAAVFQQYQEEFRDQLQKSQRKINLDFAYNIEEIVNKMIRTYNQATTNYIPEQIEEVRAGFMSDLQKKIQLSFSYQAKHIADESLKEFTDEVNKCFIRDKNIERIKALQPQAMERFERLIKRVSYRDEWTQSHIEDYQALLSRTFLHQKQKIIMDSLKDFDRSIKKQIQAIVSNSFYDKKILFQNFWDHINNSFKELQFKAKNSIVSLYNKLQYHSDKKSASQIAEQIQKTKSNAKEELKTIIKMKCNDLRKFLMRHFVADFNLDEQEIPRQWPNYKPQEITELYVNIEQLKEKLKQQYIDQLPTFSAFMFEDYDSMMESSSRKIKRFSSVNANLGDELLSSVEMAQEKKKLLQDMKKQYEEALKKNKQVYMGAIPKWAWILFAIVAFDDILLWFKSPYLALPVTLILVIVGIVFFIGGQGLVANLFNNARRAATNAVTDVAARAATGRLSNRQ